VFIELQKQQSPKTLVRRFPDTLTIAHFDTQTGQQTLPGCPNVVSVPAIKSALAGPVACEGQSLPKPSKRKDKKSWWDRLFG
jgi:penicillin-binding protein 1B